MPLTKRRRQILKSLEEARKARTKRSRQLSPISDIEMTTDQGFQQVFVEEEERWEYEQGGAADEGKEDNEGKEDEEGGGGEEEESEDDQDSFTRERQLTEEELAEEEALCEWEDAEEAFIELEEELEDHEELEEKLRHIDAQEEGSKTKETEKGKSKAPTVFGVLLERRSSADWERVERSLRAAVLTGESERQATYERAKARALATEARSMPSLTTFFKLAVESSPTLEEEFAEEFDEDEEGTQELTWGDHIAAVERYLKENKRLLGRTVNRLNHLRGYFFLRQNGRSAMQASKLVAETAVRGPYYARLLRNYAKSFIERRSIPAFRQGQHIKVKSLLEDESVELAVSSYLRANKFTVTPEKLKAYLEKEVFPSLDLPAKPTLVHVETVRKWMSRKGWVHGIYKKGVYVDGHEREDVVAYRKEFLERMLEFEKFMVEYDDKTLEPLLNDTIESGAAKQYILVTHDESTFYSNDGRRHGWAPRGEQPLRKKGRGRGLMVSDFLLETVGRLLLPEEMHAALQDPTFPQEACEIFEFGGEKGYWTGENVVKQVSQAYHLIVLELEPANC
jgi:hypothetical protein